LRLRQALSMSIDRAALARTVFAGAAQPLKATTLLPLPYAWARKKLADAYADVPEQQVDLERAKQLVQEAGAPAKPLVLGLQAGDAASLQVVNAIVDAGRKIGIPIRTKQYPAAEFIGLFFDPESRKAIDLMITTGYSDIPDPIEYFELVGLKESIQNFTGYDDKEVRRLVLQARGEEDEDKRADLVIQASQRMEKDLPIIPLLYLPERLVLSKDLGGAPVSFPYQYYPWAAHVGAAGA
jgi:peptide/nickel transport system substrate-binding protein